MDVLLDTSWTLHYIHNTSTSYTSLFDSTTTQTHLSRYFDRLASFLTSQKPQYVDDLDNASEKHGQLRECKSAIVAVASTSTPRVIHISLNYQHTIFAFILYGPHLLLSKAPVSQTRNFTTFLSDTFTISISPLKLPSNHLCTSLQHYIATLTSTHPDSNTGPNDSDTTASLLKPALGTLKLTISFCGSIAPNLRTLDISVPSETAEILIRNQTPEGKTFLDGLAKYIHLRTGLKLPIAATHADVDGRLGTGRAVSADSELDAGLPLRVSKVVTAAFAVSAEGRLKFAGKATENAGEQEDVVIAANLELIDGIVMFARARRIAEEENKDGE